MAEQYDNALGCVEQKVSILYKQKLFEVNIWSCNTVILKFYMKSQFVTRIYTVFADLISFLCKPGQSVLGRNECMYDSSHALYCGCVQSCVILNSFAWYGGGVIRGCCADCQRTQALSNLIT